MKKTLKIAVIATVILLAVVLVPLSGNNDNNFLFFLGRFHPLVLHLPIGALIILFCMEIINAKKPELHLDAACNILLWFSVFSVIPTVILGFFLAASGNYNDEALNIHQWLGWFTAIICVWLLVLRSKKTKKSPNNISKIYKVTLFVNVVLLSLAGHFGGNLTHGSNYLTKYMPESMKSVLGVTNSENYLAVKGIDSTSEEAIYFKNNVKPVMEKHCYSCHGDEKEKGGVRLDVLHWDMVNGPDAEGWHSALDMINSGEMPPEDKPQLTTEERRLVVDWMTENLEQAAIAKQTENKGVMRRLTKKQYTNSLNQLLGVNVNFGDVLPDDGKSKMGFTNNGSVLQTTALHIDYYQKIAREALDKAIVFGEKPETKHYKVTIGKNSSNGEVGAEYGGYQTASVNNTDFLIDILDAYGKPMQGHSAAEKDSIKATKNKIGLGMRGSASNRYSVVKEGMLLNAALPATEKAPKSWQGPSPNLKLLVKEDFPRTGNFVFRVEASRGYFTASTEKLIDLRENKPAKPSDEAIHISAKKIKRPKGLIKNKKYLMPDNVADNVRANFSYVIPKSGFYQIDLVHPYASDDAMPSFQISLLGKKKSGRISKRLYMDEALANEKQVVTPVTLAYLSEGKHTGYIGGKFFVGFSDIVITPLPDNDPLPKMLEVEAKENSLKYEAVNPSIQAFAGTRTDDGMDYKIFDKCVDVTAPFGETQTFEFKGRLENLPIPLAGNQVSGDLANMLTVGLWNNHLVKENNQTGPPLLIKSIAFEAPYNPVWPPESHTNIFFDSPNKVNKAVYTKEVLKRFMEKAFRRTVKPEELNRYFDFWNSIKDDFDRYEDGVKEVLVAVLCSPNFIYLFEPEPKEDEKSVEDEFYLASQLSYFLWNSPPDETLTSLAAEGDLHDDISAQIERMVKDARITKMIKAFTFEWLRLDRHKAMDTDIKKYSNYTRFVKQDMANETYEFMQHVLQNNMSILNFIDSDFAMLNQNLAEFYGIEGVKGHEFRPVMLPDSLNRGGLLSQGAFLNGHSDGVQAHPIKRAVWLKEKILGDTPPPPPPNVPELDPETPGFENLTLKEQLFLHRNKAACLDCHRKIDPYGVVFENYDAVGRFQLTAKDKPIDSKSTLPDGTEVEGVQGIKNYILKLKTEDFTRSLVEHLYAYALGRDVGFADQKEIDRIVAEVVEDDFRFQTVIEQIVLSPSFYKKKQSWFNKIFG